MSLKPQGDRIVVKQDQPESTSKGGVFIPDTGQDRAPQGFVVAVGPGRKLDDGTTVSMTVNIGDKVVFSKYTGSQIKIEGTELLIVSERDILAVIDPTVAYTI